MELFTLDDGFRKDKVVEAFNSVIWTERYYGDGDVTLVAPATIENVEKFKPDTKLGINDSDEVNILETQEIDEGILTVTGISLLKWMNNRFIRASADHEEKVWNLTGGYTPGLALMEIVQQMLMPSSYNDGTINIGIPASVAENFVIPGLSTSSYDGSYGPIVDFPVPYGPIYDALKSIATTYEIGMSLYLYSADADDYVLLFKNYKGLDRTSAQSDRPVVRFSPNMETLSKIKELQSSANHKNLVYIFSSSNHGGLATTPGVAGDTGASGFDLRAHMTWSENITDDQLGGSGTVLLNLLTNQAARTLDDQKYVALVDGEIVPNGQLKYGTHYSLGDLVEFEGHSGITSTSRVTEYIRSQDETGERAYPTIEVVE